MSTPRRPSAGRRPARPAARTATKRTATSRTATSRTATTRTATTRTATPVARRRESVPPPARRLLSPRAAVLSLVAAGLLASAALPMRAYVNQGREIDGLETAQAAQRDRIAALEAEKERLGDPAYVAAEARRRLHFVLPGETAYVVLAPEPGAVEDTAAGAESPWYTQLWGSVQEADRPTPPKR